MWYKASQAVQAHDNTQGVPLRPIVSTVGAPTCGLAKHLFGLLGLQLGQSVQHMRNAEEFVCTLNTLCVSSKDILFNFDGISLFTSVLLRGSVSLLS
jgi:hypothetical protein